MLSSNDKYNFPPNHSDPFDPEFDGNFFVYASAHSNLHKDLSYFTLDVLGANIDMGYKTLLICQRLAFIKNGNVIREWPVEKEKNDTNDTAVGKFLLTSDRQHEFSAGSSKWKSYSFPKPRSLDWSLVSYSWTDLEACKQFALLKSIETNSEMLVSVILCTHNWH